MNTAKKLSLWLIAAAFAVALFQSKSYAASSQTVTIQVSINATKSLAVNVSTYNYGALGVNVSSIATPIVVTNDSLALRESYALQGANAVSTAGGTTWTLASSTGSLDTYAMAVQFSSAAPTNVDASWPAGTNLTTSVQNCTTGSTFGNGTVGESCFQVFPTGTYAVRNMWVRMKTPVSVTDTTQRQTSIVLTIQ